MDMKLLECYRSNAAEARELKSKLQKLGRDDSCIVSSVVMDYRTGYARPQTVVGYDLSLEQRRRERWQNRLEKLQEEMDEVEGWIEAIADGLTRRCFRMYYVEGMSQRQIGMRLHLSQSSVSKKLQAI